MNRIGLLVTGCGAGDGSDVHETVCLALALERCGARTVWLAPEGPARDVVDHAALAVAEGAAPREMLAEAARLARGPVLPLRPAEVSDLAALAVPGGQGVLKNLLDGALEPGADIALAPAAAPAIAALAARRAPLLATGLAAALLEAALGPLDLDPFALAAGTALVDPGRRFVYAPGALNAVTLDEVRRGADEAVRGLARLLGIVAPAW